MKTAKNASKRESITAKSKARSGLPNLKKPSGDYRHGDLKNVLIQAAIKLIDERHEVSFTIRELAKLTGVTHTAAYRHYKSKKDILIAIAIIGFKKIQMFFDEASLQSQKTNESEVIALGRAYINFAIENPTLFQVMFHAELNDCRGNDELAVAGPKSYQTLVNAVNNSKATGRYQNGNDQEMSLAAWALVHGAATLYINGMLKREKNPTAEEMRTWALSICTILENGLRKR